MTVPHRFQNSRLFHSSSAGHRLSLGRFLSQVWSGHRPQHPSQKSRAQLQSQPHSQVGEESQRRQCFWACVVRSNAVLAGAIAGWLGLALPASGAETLKVKLGPVEQSVTIHDLETFARTGDIPPSLRLYAPLLHEDIRLALTSHVQLDPAVSDNLVDDLLQSSSGQRFLELLELAIPESEPQQFQEALKSAVRQPGGLSLLGFFRAFPTDTITVDASSAIALASQLNLPHWQSHALNSILERELTVEETPFYAPFDPSTSGHERVRQQTLTFRDRDRSRSIPVDLYWSRWSSGPLVVVSHGFGADRRFLNYLAIHLASHGLTVAALEHPGSNVAWLTGITLGESGSGRLSDILPATEFIDRPRDIRFLLDEFERLNRYSSVLGGKLNTHEVTVIGHSLGGYTALALAGAQINLPHLREFCAGRSLVELSPADWLQCSAVDLPDQDYRLRDRRVTQIIAISPVMGRIFDAEGLNAIEVPTIITSSSQDSITPLVSQQLLPFATMQGDHRSLLTAIGATHLSMGDPANLNEALTHNLFLRERQRDETEAMRRMMKGLTLAFIKQQTPEAELYAPFLSSAYVQSWSTDTVQLRLNTEVPQNLQSWVKMAAVPLEQVVSATLPKSRKKGENSVYAASIRTLTRSLPLVLLIPPSSLSVAALQFLRRGDHRKQRLKPLWKR